MSDWEVIHENTNREGELTSFLLLEDGEPTQKRATPENKLLYIRGLYDFLAGETTLQVGPDHYVKARDEAGYVMVIDGELVEVPPSYDAEFLEIVDGLVSDNKETAVEALMDLYQEIISGQVRRAIVNNCLYKFGDATSRITVKSNGWVIDGIYLCDWNANIYTIEDDPESGDYIRSGGVVERTDTSYEAIQLSAGYNETVPTDELSVTINDDTVQLTESEQTFLAKVMWLLGREHYHDDEEFWANVNDYFDNK